MGDFDGFDAADRVRARPDLDIPEPELERVPADFEPDHPRGDLVRHKALYVHWEDPTPPSIGSVGFVDWWGDRLDDLGPVHRRPATAL